MIRASSPIASLFQLAFSSGGSHLLAAAALPVLSRFYTPEEFGVYAIALSLSAIFNSFICLRYETAIVTCTSQSKSSHVYYLCLALICVTTGLAALSLSFFNDELGIANIFDLLLLTIFFQGIWLASRHSLIRAAKHKVIAIATTTQTVLTIAFQLAYLYTGLKHVGLIAGYATAVSLVATMLTAYAVLRLNKIGSLSLPLMIKTARDYKDFPLYSSLGTALNTISLQIPVVIIGSSFGNHTAGLYSMATTLLKVPANVIGNSVKQVHLQQIAHHKLSEHTKNYYSLTLAVSLPILLLAYIDPSVIGFILGKEWQDAYGALVILSFFYCVWLPTSITGNIFAVMLEQRRLLRIQFLKFILRIPPFIIASTIWDFRSSLIVFTALSVLGQILQFQDANRIIGLSSKTMFHETRKTLISFAFLLSAVSLTYVYLNTLAQLVACILLITIFYALTIPKILRKISHEALP